MKKPLSFHEIMPDEVWKWKYLECNVEKVLSLFNYQEIRLSVLQDYNILYKGITALLDTEEVEHTTNQLLNLNQPDNDVSLLSLRPEGTISVLNHVAMRFASDSIHRIYYHGPMFRKDENHKPMEFYQLGVELLGSDSILSENEVLSLVMKMCEELGLKDVWLEINSFGCQSCRPLFFKAMREFLNEHKDDFCQSCFESLRNNPLHNTECMTEGCMHNTKQGPKIQDHLCSKCKTNFSKVKKVQTNLGYDYKVNHHLFKNFSYYNETVFNIMIQTNGKPEAIGGGGRYDFLSNQITGKQIPAVGFYLNLDKVYSIMATRNLFQKPETPFRIYVCSQSDDLDIMLLQIVQELHEHNLSTVISTDSLDTQKEIENALKNDCQLMIVLRKENISEGKVFLKNFLKEKQSYVMLSDLIREIDVVRKSVQFST
jgi:histidyl-tRNA synthetase